MQHLAATEFGLALIFLGRSFTRIYVQRAVAQFGADAIAFAHMPERVVIPSWVSVLLLSGWVISVVAGVLLLVL